MQALSSVTSIRDHEVADIDAGDPTLWKALGDLQSPFSRTTPNVEDMRTLRKCKLLGIEAKMLAEHSCLSRQASHFCHVLSINNVA